MLPTVGGGTQSVAEKSGFRGGEIDPTKRNKNIANAFRFWKMRVGLRKSLAKASRRRGKTPEWAYAVRPLKFEYLSEPITKEDKDMLSTKKADGEEWRGWA